MLRILRITSATSKPSLSWQDRENRTCLFSSSVIAQAGLSRSLYTLDHQPELAGLICESFAHELPAPQISPSRFSKGSATLRRMPTSCTFRTKGVSRDPKAVEAMNEDPLIAHETQPTRTMAALVRADERLEERISPNYSAGPDSSRHCRQEHEAQRQPALLRQGGLRADLDKRVVMQDIQHWIGPRLPATLETPAQACAESLQETLRA